MTDDNVLKLKENTFKLDIRKKFFTTWGKRHWNKLPREAVEASLLEVFKTKFNRTLNNLSWWKVPVHISGVGTRCSLQIPSNHYNSMIL